VLGENKREEKLFYYLRPEELIPEDHILRLIDRYVDFSFVRPKMISLPVLRARLFGTGEFTSTANNTCIGQVQKTVGGVLLESSAPEQPTVR